MIQLKTAVLVACSLKMGALIGGASLQGKSFANIVNIFNGKAI